MILRIKNILFVLPLILTDITLGQVPFKHVIVDENGPASPWGKAVGDLNNDGYPDLIAGGWEGQLVWYRYPDWKKSVISGDRTETDIEVADLDRDGNPDVIAIGLNGLLWFKSPQWERHQIFPQIKAHDVEVADLNNDGKADIVARNQKYSVNSGDTIHLFIQGGTTDSWNYFPVVCQKGEGVQVADINSDGKSDLLIGKFWYENTGQMDNWIGHVYAPSWDYPHTYLATGDINGDSLADIVLAPAEPAGGTYKIAWYEHPENVYQEWEEHILVEEIETTCHFVGTADFNNDGKTDIAVAEMEQSSDPDEVFLLLNQDYGQTWQKQVLAVTGSHSMQIADIDMDGDCDLYGANWNNNREIELRVNLTDTVTSNSLDKWQRHVVDSGKDWISLFVDGKDLTGDGLPEIITGAWWYSNPGTAGGDWIRHNIGSPLNNMAIVYDFDDDGDYDILGTEGEGAVGNSRFVWARNNGTGSFTIFDNIERAQGDFLQGVAVVRKGMEFPYLVALSWHLPGQGVQTLTVPPDPEKDRWVWQKISESSQDESLSAGDINLDGEPDLLLGTWWLRNNNGNWVQDSLFTTGNLPDRNKLADIDNDGLPDAVIGYEAISTVGKLAWYKQSDLPSNEWKENIIANIIGPMSLDVADMDNDGDPDVVAGEHNLTNPDSAGLFVFENTAKVGSEWKSHLVYKGDEHHDGAVTVDIDNDGDLDILSVGWGHNKVLLYENRATVVVANDTANQDEIPSELKVYPNPANDMITIQLKITANETLDIKIFSINGTSVYHTAKDGFGNIFTTTVSTHGWNPGIYFIHVQTHEKVYIEKCIVSNER